MTDARDKVVPLSGSAETLGRSLHREVGRRRMNVLLEKPNAAALVRALPAEDLFFLVKDVGLHDAAVLVGLASPQQFQSFIDLDAWSRGEFGPELDTGRVLEWLGVSRDGDPEAHAGKALSLDLELIELALRRGLHLVDLREEEEAPRPAPPPPGTARLAWQRSPCGNFMMAFEENDGTAELRRLVEDLYAADAFGASRLLSAVLYELPSELEEEALRIRTGRLEDLGFPPADQAASLYAFRDPDAEVPPQPAPAEPVPGFVLAGLRGDGFLELAAGRVTGVERRTRLDRSLMYLVNSAMVADRVDPSEPEAVRGVMARVRAYLGLGLEHLAGGSLERGAELLAGHALKSIFQVGFSLGLKLQWRCERLLETHGLEREALLELLGSPMRETVAATLALRPALATALEAARDGGWPDAPEAAWPLAPAPAQTPAASRPFASAADLAAVSEALDGLESLLAFAADTGLLPREGEDVDPLEVRIATAAMRVAGGGAFTAHPLTREEFDLGLDSLFDPEGRALGSAIDDLATRLRRGGATPTWAQRIAAGVLGRVAAEVGPVLAAGEQPDPRFVSAVRSG